MEDYSISLLMGDCAASPARWRCCGPGRDMAYLHLLGKTVYGTDATLELVDYARALHPELRGSVSSNAVPVDSVPFGGAFDGVLRSAVLMLGVPSLEFLEPLHQRNEYLIVSHYPLRETLIHITGWDSAVRTAFLNRLHQQVQPSPRTAWKSIAE